MFQKWQYFAAFHICSHCFIYVFGTGISVFLGVTVACRSVASPGGIRFQPGDLKYDYYDDFVGAGGFADVYRVVISQNKQEMIVAVKKFKISISWFTDGSVHVGLLVLYLCNWTHLAVKCMK